MRIAFMGTPEFAVPSLSALIDGGHEIVGAFTQPDRPAGRGHRLSACPVKVLAEQRGVPVFQFERVRRPEGIAAMAALRPDVIVTAAFGQILPQALLDIPKIGTVNVHASLLPKYRGAAPINWCLIEGETQSGVTTMMTDAGIDTGDMLLQAALDILPEETAGELTERLSLLGARLLMETLSAIEQGTCPRTPQDHAQASHQPMMKKELGLIDFAQSAGRIENLVRGVNPWPGAYAMLPEGALKVWKARAVSGDFPGKPGEVVEASAKGGLLVRCGEGALELIEIQAPNAKRMQAKVYLMGKTIPVGTVLNG